MVFSHIVKILRSWIPYTYASPDDPELSALLAAPWLEGMAANPNIKPVLGAARMLAPDSELPDDHLVRLNNPNVGPPIASVYQNLPTFKFVPVDLKTTSQLETSSIACRIMSSLQCHIHHQESR